MRESSRPVILNCCRTVVFDARTLRIERGIRAQVGKSKQKNLGAKMKKNERFELLREVISDLLDAGKTNTEIANEIHVSLSTIKKVKRLKREGKSLETSKRTGRPRSARTEEVIEQARAITENPVRTNISKLSRQLGITRRTGERLLKEDLKCKSLKIREVPSVGNSADKRLNRAKLLLNWVKNSDHSHKVRIFSDEKLFVIDAKFHRQNDRYLSNRPVKMVDPSIKFNSVCKNPVKVMVLGIVGSDGKKCPIIFIDQDVRINSQIYQDLLAEHFLPWVRENYSPGEYVFQQDGATCHTAKATAAFLKREGVEFWDKDMWPPASPDLNPLDYAIWSRLVREVNSVRHTSKANLKIAIQKAWDEMDARYLVHVTGRFRNRLQRVLDGNGAYLV